MKPVFGLTDPALIKQHLAKESFNHKEKKDCAVKAVSVVCDAPYNQTHSALRKAGRPHGGSTYTSQINAAVRSFGYDVELVMQKQVRQRAGLLRVRHVGAMYPKGQYLVYVRGHVLPLVDGHVIDWTAGRGHVVREVYRVTKAGEPVAPAELPKQVKPAPAPNTERQQGGTKGVRAIAEAAWVALGSPETMEGIEAARKAARVECLAQGFKKNTTGCTLCQWKQRKLAALGLIEEGCHV